MKKLLVFIVLLTLLFSILFLIKFGIITHPPKKHNVISYLKDYHYVLQNNYKIRVPIMENAEYDHIKLNNGILILERGFAWNGATGTYDSKHRIRASMVHDALWVLMIHHKISKDYKETIDDVYLKLIEEDGETHFFAKISELAFKTVGGYFFAKDKIYYAP